MLDEPTTGLDAVAKRELFSKMLAFVGDSDRTILISSHSLSDIERFADHLGIICGGVMLHEGPMTDIVERYSIVDFSLSGEASFQGGNGLTCIRREGGRVRALADRHAGAFETLPGRPGGKPLRVSGHARRPLRFPFQKTRSRSLHRKIMKALILDYLGRYRGSFVGAFLLHAIAMAVSWQTPSLTIIVFVTGASAFVL